LKLIDKLQAEGIDALYFGGYTAEAGLIIRQARSRGYDLQMIGSDALATEYFEQVAGPAAVGRAVCLVRRSSHQRGSSGTSREIPREWL
jgi:ABC-type branched-subunit amino acid transport system substrate-binding protein